MAAAPLLLLFSVVVEVRRDLDTAAGLALFLGCFAMLILLNKHPRRTWASTFGIVALWGVLRSAVFLGLMALAAHGLIELAAPVGQRELSALNVGWVAVGLGVGSCVVVDTLRRIRRPPRAGLTPSSSRPF